MPCGCGQPPAPSGNCVRYVDTPATGLYNINRQVCWIQAGRCSSGHTLRCSAANPTLDLEAASRLLDTLQEDLIGSSPDQAGRSIDSALKRFKKQLQQTGVLRKRVLTSTTRNRATGVAAQLRLAGANCARRRLGRTARTTRIAQPPSQAPNSTSPGSVCLAADAWILSFLHTFHCCPSAEFLSAEFSVGTGRRQLCVVLSNELR